MVIPHDETEDIVEQHDARGWGTSGLKKMRVKLFFRTDIYHALTYVNKDHFSAVKLELRWSKEDLAILLAHRLQNLHPEHKGALTFPVSIEWINQLFDWPANNALKSFDAFYDLMRDGNGDVIAARSHQLLHRSAKATDQFRYPRHQPTRERKIDLGTGYPRSIRPKTAAFKLNDFLQVFQNFSETYDQLKVPTSVFDRAIGYLVGEEDPLDAEFMVIADLVRVGALAIRDQQSR